MGFPESVAVGFEIENEEYRVAVILYYNQRQVWDVAKLFNLCSSHSLRFSSDIPKAYSLQAIT